MVATRYQDVRAADRPRVALPGVVLDVVSGTVAGVSGPARNSHPVQGVIVTLDPGASYDLAVPAAHRAFAYVLDGELSLSGRPVRAGDTAWSDPVGRGTDSQLQIAARDGDAVARVMVFSGEPLREPVAMGGPFVMNRRVEIAQAFADFHAGTFGEVPRQARLKYDR
jgi:redox-sensitive bicupin YhaK (pirin superfamily)